MSAASAGKTDADDRMAIPSRAAVHAQFVCRLVQRQPTQ